MLRKLVLVALFAMFLVPAAASAQFDEGDWEMTLAGSGQSESGFDSTALSVNVSLGYFFNDNFEVGARQLVTFVESDESGSDFSGATTGFVDYHFDLDRWQPFVGAFIGLQYGDNVEDDGTYGPEGGVKYFVNSTTFIAGTIQYVVSFDNNADEYFRYSLGLGFKW